MDQDDSGKERSSSPRDKRVSELFLTACDMSAGGREAFLDQACAGDPELRAAVESLLAHDATGVLGTRSLTEQVRGMHSELGTDAHPTRIGPYKILQVLGVCGIGIVYIAEQ